MVLITINLEYVFKSGYKSSKFTLLFQIALPILGSLHLYLNF